MKRTGWMGFLAGGVVGATVFTAVTALNAQNRGFSGVERVVCLDVVKLVSEYQRQKDLTEEARAVELEIQNEMERRRGRIDSLQLTLDNMRAGDSARVTKIREMFRLQLDYRNWAELMQAEMAREVGVWTRKMYTEILEVTEELALREGYDIVLYMSPPAFVGFDPESIRSQIRSRKVVYASPTVDITQQVLDKLNADYRAQPKTQMLQISPTLGP